MKRGSRLDFALYERAGESPVPIDDVDFGSLLGSLGGRTHSHVLSVEYRRTQEIELLAAVVVFGATAFALSYLKTLGAEFAKWTVEELKRRGTLRRARIEGARKRVVVTRSRQRKAAEDLAALFTVGVKRGSRIEIVFEAGRAR